LHTRLARSFADQGLFFEFADELADKPGLAANSRLVIEDKRICAMLSTDSFQHA